VDERAIRDGRGRRAMDRAGVQGQGRAKRRRKAARAIRPPPNAAEQLGQRRCLPGACDTATNERGRGAVSRASATAHSASAARPKAA
jgi:hypothetical protein